MLLLPAPSRRSHDVAISLRAPAGDINTAIHMAEEAMGSSCPEDKAQRVKSAIFHSGRYDCRVSESVIANIRILRNMIAPVGGEVLIMEPVGPKLAQWADL